ncbi:2,3-bisphosphoglycerate-independent phosphoglycerate mutase [Bacilliculturomica massiliensis]|uniref:2,3-bisphosphoglycerate-independent phosphoglycerate mutase n=1 Tax=Bacilliculturomica massiliensis TaxID=1917867 RepID=UPI0013EEFFBA
MKKTTMLMILDGFGQAPAGPGNAVAQARKPNLDALFARCPHTVIGASGLSVGLPDGQMGNSEVGHLNIGAGRIVYQELTKITKAIQDGGFYENKALNQAMDHAADRGSSLHLMGLLSDGGVHSHISHLFALLELAKKKNLKRVYVHALLDGRDVPPRCAQQYFDQLETRMAETGLGQIATIAGRYYTMDRDSRWEREQLSYDAMTLGEGFHASSASEALAEAYERGENDEFVKPTVITGSDGRPLATVDDGDSLIFFNFRPDRARQITRAFVDDTFTGFERKKRPADLCYVCMTQYDAEMPAVLVAFPPQSLKNTLGEYLSSLAMTQLRIAETEKYAHVTFFFNGGVEAPNNGEDRILVPSPKVATYDLQPEMSACEVTDRVIEQIDKHAYDVIILNFANCDMVGHTGVMDAAIKAVETVDSCVGRIVSALNNCGGQLILTADHGNADCMLDENGSVVTAHSLNPVPLLVMTDHTVTLAEGGVLADLSPTLLDLMGLPKPLEMTGKSLLVR